MIIIESVDCLISEVQTFSITSANNQTSKYYDIDRAFLTTVQQDLEQEK